MQLLNYLYHFSRRFPIIKWTHRFQRDAAQQFAVAVGNVNMAWRMIADPPFKNITAATDFAHFNQPKTCNELRKFVLRKQQ